MFLLDMVHLPRRVREKTLRQFVSEVFGSANTLKLGMCVCVCVSIYLSVGVSVGMGRWCVHMCDVVGGCVCAHICEGVRDTW